jgi:site-specific DNA-methyltransferase (adenine-specific)
MPNDLFTKLYNPDVLSCLANLSNDEVFTPPSIANQMLDMLPQEIFADPNTTFLDPACKSGVFLREIAKRLIAGLESVIPNLNERIDHIFHKQLFAIAITELTSLLSRRSTYCSKYPNGQYSVSYFNDVEGNIRFKKIQHVWENSKCVFCGANKAQYDRASELETHAYEFIHTIHPEEIFNMQFDVIIGNPPYQLSDGGHGASAMPIYQKFIQQAKKLKPRFLTMIVPSRWFTGGRGLDGFRDEMLHDDQIRVIHDFPDASDCFPGVEIKGGVSYFLWAKKTHGDCKVYTHEKGQINESTRPLLEDGMNIFIRDNRQISILRKVQSKKEKLFYDMMSANDPFGYDVRVENSYLRIKPKYVLKKTKGACKFYYFGWREQGVGFVDSKTVRKGQDLINVYKVYVPRAWGTGDTATDRLNAFIGEPNSVCTETYSVIGPLKSREEADNVLSYIGTKFFHFLVAIVKITQAAAKHVYKLVPMQDFSHPLKDEELYAKYDLSSDEIKFIESLVRPLDK